MTPAAKSDPPYLNASTHLKIKKRNAKTPIQQLHP